MKFTKLIKAEEQPNSNFSKLEKICEKLDWNVELQGDVIELSQYSNAGEDFRFCIDNDEHLGKQIFEYAENFDVDEHIEMWLEAKRNGTGGVPSARILVEDAEEIQQSLNELANATREIW